MGFTIPNEADASYPHQARLYSSDFTVLGAGIGGATGVISGCAVTEADDPAMAVDVASGVVLSNLTTQATITGETLDLADADATNPRWDLIVANSVGTLAVHTGTAGASPVPPQPAALIAGTAVGLAYVYIPANDTAVTDAQIVDKRVIVPAPLGTAQWTTLSCAADLSRSSDATPTNDDTLYFTAASNTKYRIRARLLMYAPASVGWALKLTGPASPTLVASHWHTPNPTTGLDASGRFESAYSTSNYSQTPSAATNNFVYLESVIHNGATSGTVAMQWSQAVSNASATIRRAGSYLEYEVA